MRQFRLALAITIGCTLSFGITSPASAVSSGHALESKAGQFCKVADIGKKKIADNGARIKCTKDGSRARWKNTK
jgi:hypothetical protein